MAKPVVIDDGGSTRIRQLNDNTGMDGLLAPSCTDSAPDPFNGGPHGAFLCRLTVRYFEEDGNHQVRPSAVGLLLLVGDTVVISSDAGSGQSATMTFDKTSLRMNITLTGAGSNPDVEEETDVNGFFRYIVSNADSIQNVTVTHKGGGSTQVYPDLVGANPSIFTMVHFHYK